MDSFLFCQNSLTPTGHLGSSGKMENVVLILLRDVISVSGHFDAANFALCVQAGVKIEAVGDADGLRGFSEYCTNLNSSTET